MERERDKGMERNRKKRKKGGGREEETGAKKEEREVEEKEELNFAHPPPLQKVLRAPMRAFLNSYQMQLQY